MSAQTIVIKIGSSSLTYENGKLNLRQIDRLARVLSDLKNCGHQVVLVSSGAISVGVAKLSLPQRPTAMPDKQAAAAVGQCELMYIYDRFFSEYGQTVAQVLLTRDVVERPQGQENVLNTFLRLFAFGTIPIVNENDTVATEEIDFGDNDTLSAVVARLVKADLLVLLSDIDGLYDADPHTNPDAKRIALVPRITPEVVALGGGAGSRHGTGGMATKISAAAHAGQDGIDTVIASAQDPAILYRILDGEPVGTRFLAKHD